MINENSYFETSWNLHFSALKPEPSSVFWLILPSILHQAGQFRNQSIQPENQSRNLNWKKISVREWKCSGNINSTSGYQYGIFTRNCECFGCIVEPWNVWKVPLNLWCAIGNFFHFWYNFKAWKMQLVK